MRKVLLLILFISFIFADGPPVAQSIAVLGNVQAATNPNAKGRSLKRGSELFISDFVLVGDNSKTQIKFIDGGLVTMIQNTVYRIASYEFTEKKSSVDMEILVGGFRAMTGTIGKEHPTDYRVQTPVGTLGVRGTIFRMMIAPDEFGELKMTVVAESGRVIVTNESGDSATINPGQCVSASSDSMEAITTMIPSFMSAADFSNPPGGISLEKQQASINANPIAPPTPAQYAQMMQEGLPPLQLVQEGGSGVIEIHIPEEVGNPSCS